MIKIYQIKSIYKINLLYKTHSIAIKKEHVVDSYLLTYSLLFNLILFFCEQLQITRLRYFL